MTLSVYMAKVPTNDATLLEFMRRVNFPGPLPLDVVAYSDSARTIIKARWPWHCYRAAPKLQNGND